VRLSYNRVVLSGNLTHAPELSYSPSGTAICDFGLATMHKRGDREEVCYVDCRMFGRQAEILHQYLKKGSPIFVEGRLHLSVWEKDGRRMRKLRVVVEMFQFMGKIKDKVKAKKPSSVPDAPGEEVTGADFADEDIECETF